MFANLYVVADSVPCLILVPHLVLCFHHDTLRDQEQNDRGAQEVELKSLLLVCDYIVSNKTS